MSETLQLVVAIISVHSCCPPDIARKGIFESWYISKIFYKFVAMTRFPPFCTLNLIACWKLQYRRWFIKMRLLINILEFQRKMGKRMSHDNISNTIFCFYHLYQNKGHDTYFLKCSLYICRFCEQMYINPLFHSFPLACSEKDLRNLKLVNLLWR